ncbi:hypothetical protein SDC9_132270 [bioreactor metagenome]|uniref:Uncharacterized protein n=1 Tax=bioreactor metagenome TaxID=1076179 RepID=A0A645D996_9ZZZZ
MYQHQRAAMEFERAAGPEAVEYTFGEDGRRFASDWIVIEAGPAGALLAF